MTSQYMTDCLRGHDFTNTVGWVSPVFFFPILVLFCRLKIMNDKTKQKDKLGPISNFLMKSVARILVYFWI